MEAKQLDVLEKSIDNFDVFVELIASQSTEILKGGQFTGGDHVEKICRYLQGNKLTMRVSAKDHFKSLSFYFHIMWKIWRMQFGYGGREIQYFSYGGTMAAYHTAKIKQAIECNPYFANIVDLKPRAEGVLSYQWNNNAPKTSVTPRGLLEFKRGIHCDDVYVDDPFQDPENKLVPTKISKINEVMKTQIVDMYQQELHIAGTAQTPHDFFFDPEFAHRFTTLIEPAIVNEQEKKVLWEEWMSYEELMSKKRERGEKVFNQEYMCSPVYAEHSFITPDRYDACVNRDNKNWSFIDWENEEHPDYDRVGGFDIGKKSHPSHFVVFEKNLQTDRWVQIHSKWMDGWDYTDQIDYLQQAIRTFGIYEVNYDSTRGEFEAMDEKGQLPAEMTGVPFTHKSKHSMATQIDKALSDGNVELLSDVRQRSQCLMVTNDLQAPSTPEGHGDSFWSLGLALRNFEGANVSVTVI